MRKRIAKLTLFSLLLSASLFTPQPTYAGSFWGWETIWQGSYITNTGCLYLVETEVYNVFGLEVSRRTKKTFVDGPSGANCEQGTTIISEGQ